MRYNLSYVPPPVGEDKEGQALRHQCLHYMMQEEKKSYIGPSVSEDQKGQESRHRN